MVSKYGKRPSIKEILSEGYWQNNQIEMVSSWRDKVKELGLASMASILTGSGIFFIPYMAGLGQKIGKRIGIKCKRKIERSFSHTYPLVVLSLTVSLHETGRKIIGVEDTTYGSIIEAELPGDSRSFPGTLFFEIYEKGPSETYIIGTSIVKGQLIDYGKGKKTLREVFDYSGQFIHNADFFKK